MCGRFSLTQPAEVIAERFQLDLVPPLEPQYNIAPTSKVATVLVDPENKLRQLRFLHWGLIPSWAKDPKIGSKMINARAETVAEKPAFRAAFQHRRCLILADGFYEWQQLQGKKQPYYIRLQDGEPFAFAGLWEHYQGEVTIDSCTLLTTEPNELIRPIHNRMPVILKAKDYDLWLNLEVQQSERLSTLLCPYPSSKMSAYRVSTKVNNPTNNNPECIERKSK